MADTIRGSDARDERSQSTHQVNNRQDNVSATDVCVFRVTACLCFMNIWQHERKFGGVHQLYCKRYLTGERLEVFQLLLPKL